MTRGPRGGQTLVAEVVPAGRGAAARPAFAPDPPVPLLKRGRGEARIGDLVTVRVRGRSAEVVRVHGPARSAAAAMAGLLDDDGLEREFHADVAAEAEAAAADPGEDPGRRDLTGQRVVTIDPEGAKDHDD